jgi:CheY-like chemotaxis protein
MVELTMNATQDLTEIARRLRQDPQEIARNAARGGQRVVGFVGNDVPVALILASGSLPVRLRVVASAATEGADRFVEGSFAPEVRVIANQWLQGVYDHLHAVVFARSDDSAQRLYYYLCELQRRRLCAGPLPLLYDIAGLARDASFEHTLDSTRLLASQLGASTSALAPAIERVSQRAALLRAVRERRLLPAPLPGSAAWAFSHASDCDWRAEFDDAGHRWLDDVATMPGAKRIVLAGDLPPGDQLHLAIEAAGARAQRVRIRGPDRSARAAGRHRRRIPPPRIACVVDAAPAPLARRLRAESSRRCGARVAQ